MPVYTYVKFFKNYLIYFIRTASKIAVYYTGIWLRQVDILLHLPIPIYLHVVFVGGGGGVFVVVDDDILLLLFVRVCVCLIP